MCIVLWVVKPCLVDDPGRPAIFEGKIGKSGDREGREDLAVRGGRGDLGERGGMEKRLEGRERGETLVKV